MPRISVQDLRPGDILVHSGIGQISELIKWASDSIYSHAAMVYNDTMVAEAMSKGVRFDVPLAERAVDTADFSQIDVIRPREAISPANLALLQASAQSLKALPFALNEMVELGLICIARNKITDDPRGRLLIWWLASKLLPSSSTRLVCSEFVYRTYHGAATVPPRIIDPVIQVLPGSRTAAPFPTIDWGALWDEYEKARQNGDPAGAAALPAAPDMTMQVDKDTLVQAMSMWTQPLRSASDAASAVDGMVEGGAPPSPIRVTHPVPASVLPQDLADSPTFQPLGRLL